MRTRPLAALALVAGLAFAAPADAGLEVGDRALPWTAEEAVGGDPLEPGDVRGRLVLFEFIGTG